MEKMIGKNLGHTGSYYKRNSWYIPNNDRKIIGNHTNGNDFEVEFIQNIIFFNSFLYLDQYVVFINKH